MRFPDIYATRFQPGERVTLDLGTTGIGVNRAQRELRGCVVNRLPWASRGEMTLFEHYDVEIAVGGRSMLVSSRDLSHDAGIEDYTPRLFTRRTQ